MAGEFKEEWNSTGALELVGLPAGMYKTKVSPQGGGASSRATFEVKDGEACELTYSAKKGSEWQLGDCAKAK